MKKSTDFTRIPNRIKAERLELEYDEREAWKQYEKDLQKKLNLNYRYFRFWEKDKEVSISMGYKVYGNSTIKYAIALQSKKDSFSRKEARKTIHKRWLTHCTASVIKDFFTTKQIGLLLACHYNSRQYTPLEYGVKLNIPKYLSRIPILCV